MNTQRGMLTSARGFRPAIARGLIAARWWLLGAALVLYAVAFPAARRTRYDYSLENMFAPRDQVVRDYRRFQAVFGADKIILAVYDDPNLLAADGSGLRRAAEITRRLRAAPGVREVVSLSVLDQLLAALGSSILAADDPLAAAYRRMFAGYTHSQDGRVAAAVCVLDSTATLRGDLRSVVAGLRAVMRELPDGLAPGVIVGEPVMVSDGFQYVEEDAQRLGWLSASLLGLTVVLCLRSVRWAVISLLVVFWTITLTRAVLAWSGLEISMVSSMLTAVVTVVGVATVMHVAVNYRDLLVRRIPPAAALEQTWRWLLAPVFWACATDALGFAALMAAEAGPVRDFGLMMGIGSSFVFVATLLLVPGLALLGALEPPPSGTPRRRRLESGLRGLLRAVDAHPRATATLVTIIAAVLSAGAWWLEAETDFTRNFRGRTPLATAYERVETRLGGAGIWDVMIPAPPALDDAYVQRVLRFEQALRQLRQPGSDSPALTKVLSLMDVLEEAKASRLLGSLPVELRAKGLASLMPGFLSALRGTDPASGQAFVRIMLRSYDRRQATERVELIREVERLAAEHFPPDPGTPGPTVTGVFVLLTNIVSGLLRDQWICFAVATVGIGLSMAVALGSLSGAGAALVTNALPILITLGIVGWSGLKLNMGAAMTAAISLGLSVDSSLHYLFAYHRARSGGCESHAALGESQQSVGRALVFATLALAVGFLSLCTSDFVPTIYFGALAGLTLLGGLGGNLIVLPLLIEFFQGRHRPQHGSES